MLIDSQNEFSNKQTVAIAVGNVDSTNIIDLGVDRDIGKGEPVPIRIQVTTDIESAGAGTLQVILLTDDAANFPSAETLYTSGVIAKGTLVAGYVFELNYVPRTNQRFLKLNYVVGTADLTAGNIQAQIGSHDQTNKANV